MLVRLANLIYDYVDNKNNFVYIRFVVFITFIILVVPLLIIEATIKTLVFDILLQVIMDLISMFKASFTNKNKEDIK